MAEATDGKLYSADAKLGFDDNAEFRQAALFEMKDETQEDSRWERRMSRNERLGCGAPTCAAAERGAVGPCSQGGRSRQV